MTEHDASTVIRCRLCGQTLQQLAERGAYLQRVSPKGYSSFVGECRPSCKSSGTQNDAVLRAVKGEDE
jgi:hypothetical protein